MVIFDSVTTCEKTPGLYFFSPVEDAIFSHCKIVYLMIKKSKYYIYGGIWDENIIKIPAIIRNFALFQSGTCYSAT